MRKTKHVKYDIATPYTAVFVVFRKNGKIAFLLRSNTDWMNNHYGLPAGRVEKDEPISLAAIREAKEEVGVDIAHKDLKHRMTVHRDSDDSVWVDVIFEAEKWDGELYNAEPHKHGELSWFSPDNLPENMVPAVRFYIEQLPQDTTYAEYGWDD